MKQVHSELYLVTVINGLVFISYKTFASIVYGMLSHSWDLFVPSLEIWITQDKLVNIKNKKCMSGVEDLIWHPRELSGTFLCLFDPDVSGHEDHLWHHQSSLSWFKSHMAYVVDVPWQNLFARLIFLDALPKQWRIGMLLWACYFFIFLSCLYLCGVAHIGFFHTTF